MRMVYFMYIFSLLISLIRYSSFNSTQTGITASYRFGVCCAGSLGRNQKKRHNRPIATYNVFNHVLALSTSQGCTQWPSTRPSENRTARAANLQHYFPFSTAAVPRGLHLLSSVL